ncbi:hypothetical protein [Streptomyces niger]|nr:hypothetical protein [Streptomyces niger]
MAQLGWLQLRIGAASAHTAQGGAVALPARMPSSAAPADTQ